MQDHGTALTALDSWLRARMDGNVADWSLDETRSAIVAVRGQTGFTFEWKQTRARATAPLDRPSIDVQVREALDRKPLDVALTEVATAKPRAWLRPLADKDLPGYAFSHTRRETCDSCSGRQTLDCGTCGATGRVSCGTCRGSGTENEICNQCGGMGHHRRTRQVQVYGPNGYQWTTENYNENCWGCGGTGRRQARCRTCNGGGRVNCGACGGAGKVTCGDCGGQGSRHYLYVRKALVSARSGLALDEVADQDWRALLRSRWEQLLDSGAMTIANVRRKDAAAEGVLKLYFDASGAAAGALARSGNSSARLHAIGAADPVVDGEPFLARIFDLPGDGEDADWVALADRLTGTRLLREAIDVTEAMPKTAGNREQRAAAESSAIANALRPRYGAVLGGPGAAALAAVVVRGVGALREREARKVWRGNLGIAALIGLAGALICIGMMMNQYDVTDRWAGYFAYALLGTLAAGLAWGVAGHARVRAELRTLARRLDLETPLTPPRHGWTKAGWLIAALITAATVLGMTYGAWRLRVPPAYRYAIDRQLAFAGGIGSTIDFPDDRQLYLWPDPAAPVIATVPAGDSMSVYDDGPETSDGWLFVSARGVRGYIRMPASGFVK